MRKAFVSVAFVTGTTLLACSFKVGTDDPKTPQSTGPSPLAPPTAAPAPSPTTTGTPGSAMGRAKPKTTPTPAATATAPGAVPTAPGTAPAPPPSTPTSVPILSGTNAFGSGTPDPSGWKGSVYWLPAGTQKLPQLGSMQPAGFLFAKQLNTAARAPDGFPGIDPNRKEDFAIRFEAPLIVDNEADYDFRIVSDDGSIVAIDGTTIVDNDGAHDQKEKSGPVHLVKGTHAITVDYFQTKGNVTLQLFCKKSGAAEQICPTRL